MANSMVYTLTAEQAAQLKDILEQRGWEMSVVPYSIFKASGEKVSVVAYESGKLVVQGKNAQEFIEFTLEPEILHTFGTLLPPEPSAEDLSPHGGIDESGKGDFFGPLVIAGVCVDEKIASALRQIGVCDSKLVTSSKKIFALAEEINVISREDGSGTRGAFIELFGIEQKNEDGKTLPDKVRKRLSCK